MIRILELSTDGGQPVIRELSEAAARTAVLTPTPGTLR